MPEQQAAPAATTTAARRSRRPSRAERAASGKAKRGELPLEALAQWEPPSDRADPVDLLTAQDAGRLQGLVPVRHGRMLRSALSFYRGGAAAMAADLASGPHTGLQVQLCGDAHLSNFGVYGSPERSLVFDVNDFDETLPGPFEWDVKRLIASLVIAARGNGLSRKKARAVALAGARAYREAMATFAGMDTLTTWYTQLRATDIIAVIQDPQVRRNTEKLVARATTRDVSQAAAKLTTVSDGRRRMVSQPPLIVPFGELPKGLLAKDLDRGVRANFAAYKRSLRHDVAVLLRRYELADIALKVVGVGSVGTLCAVALFTGHDIDDVLFLQVKQAGRSVLEPYLRRSPYRHSGERVVAGQRLIQSASDIFLGWSNGPEGGEFYWRQLRDWKRSVVVENLDIAHLQAYARLCAWTLAKGHARSGDAVAIAAYLGKKDRFDGAMADFGEAYAAQNEADYAAVKQAAADGRVAVAEEAPTSKAGKADGARAVAKRA